MSNSVIFLNNVIYAVKNILHLDNSFDIILGIKRICYFPKEIMNLCVIVITVTENPFCKIAGRLRTIGQPAIRITFSKVFFIIIFVLSFIC